MGSKLREFSVNRIPTSSRLPSAFISASQRLPYRMDELQLHELARPQYATPLSFDDLLLRPEWIERRAV